MQLILRNNIPFTQVVVSHGGQSINIPNVLIDTGSGSTVLSADLLQKISIEPKPEDILHTIHGVGGYEVVFTRKVVFLEVGEKRLVEFEIEVGGLDLWI